MRLNRRKCIARGIISGGYFTALGRLFDKISTY